MPAFIENDYRLDQPGEVGDGDRTAALLELLTDVVHMPIGCDCSDCYKARLELRERALAFIAGCREDSGK